MLSRIRARYPEVQVSAGGGIASIAEVYDLKAAGASAVLVASALHDGRIGWKELQSVCSSESGC